MFHEVIGPLLALIGTLLATLVGYRQWRKQEDSSRTAEFMGERDKTYQELWQKLEAVHISARVDKFEAEKFNRLVQAVNIYAMERALYLDQSVKRQVNDYMTLLRKLGNLLEHIDATEAKEEACATGAIAPAVLGRVKGLTEAYTAVEQQRNSLITHFKNVLTART